MNVKDVELLILKATPGPWRADGEPWNRVVWSSADNRVCFMAHSNGLDDERDIATSNLAAAAPDLARQLLAAMARLADVDTPEWKSMADWSDLPDVYVTKAECQQGMFWRIEACSVPMAIGPEMRLIRADRVAAKLADADMAQAALVERAAEIDFPDDWRDERGLKEQRHFGDGFRACRAAIRELAPDAGMKALAELRARERESAMQALASMGQAQEAYEAQLKAEADNAALRARLAAELAEARAQVEALRGALRAEHAYWDAKAAADLRLQDAGEVAMDYPMPRRMTEAMRKADDLAAALAAAEKDKP